MTVKALGAAGEGAARSLGMLRDPQKGVAGPLDLASWPTRCSATRHRLR